MDTRRTFLTTIGTGASALLAGCFNGRTPGNFELTGIGIIEREQSVASFIDVKNISSNVADLEIQLAAYTSDGVRVSDWKYVSRYDVQPNSRVRAYEVFESGDSGWADTNDLGQVVDTHSTRAKLRNEPRIYGSEDIGTVIKK